MNKQKIYRILEDLSIMRDNYGYKGNNNQSEQNFI